MSGLDDERLRAEIEAKVDWWGEHVGGSTQALVDTFWPLVAELSAVRDREAERADAAETLLTEIVLAEAGESSVTLSDALAWAQAWYTSAAMKAGQQGPSGSGWWRGWWRG